MNSLRNRMKQFALVLLLLLYTSGSYAADPRLRSPYFKDGEFHNLQPPAVEHTAWDYFWKIKGEEEEEWPDLQDFPFEKFPIPKKHLPKDQVRVTPIFHSTMLIQMDGLNILTDPIWSERASPYSFMGPIRSRLPALTLEELPPIDILLISHNHYDHMDISTLRKIVKKHDPLILVGLGNKKLLRSRNIQKVVKLDWFELLTETSAPELSSLQITFVPAQHFSARTPFDKNETLWGSFVIKGAKAQIYFAGDSGMGPHFAMIREKFGPMDFALIPIGAYEPRWFMQYYHMNPAEAVQTHLILEAKQSLGIHYGSIQLTHEGMNQPVIDLEKALQEAGLPREAVLTPPFGKGIDISVAE